VGEAADADAGGEPGPAAAGDEVLQQGLEGDAVEGVAGLLHAALSSY
jgi:hypothetical protein